MPFKNILATLLDNITHLVKIETGKETYSDIPQRRGFSGMEYDR